MSTYTKIKIFVAEIGKFWEQKLNATIFRWNLLFIIAPLALVLFKFSTLPPQIPLYYSRPWGEPQLVSSPTVFLPIILSVLILLINNSLAVVMSKSNSLLSRLLITVSLLFSMFSSITLFRVISMVA